MINTVVKTTLQNIGGRYVLRFANSAGSLFNTRNIVMAHVMIKSKSLQSVLEPDGNKGHWFEVDKDTIKQAKITPGEEIEVHIKQVDEWIEPNIPKDLKNALKSNSKVYDLWLDITPMARWEWIRWIRDTKNPLTRAKRIQVSISKLSKGSRRPCCFDTSKCTVPEVSKNGVLNL